MKSTRIVGSGTVLAAVGLMIAVLAYAYAQSSVADRTAVASTAAEAAQSRLEVEARIARTGLLGETRATLGDAFAGVWFDGAAGQLHVGVVSPAAHRDVEAVAAKAGLAGRVIETPVDSSWEQLQTAQDRWSRRLADLFEQAEVSTALRARYNAIEVELGSAVPAAERDRLEREARADSVNVLITVAPTLRLGFERDKRCRAFEEKKAYCDPTIVAGVRLENQAAEGCTTGPAAFPQDHMKPTETYILTAGHCIDPKEPGGEGIGGNWYAYPKGATKEAERKLVGKAVDFINDKRGDVGVVKVENAEWMTKGFTPVHPAVALWTEVESDPKVVTAEQEVSEGLESCMSGQSSGTSCGKILKTEVEFLGSEGLVEVEAGRKPGDSGAPWYNKGIPAIMEGTHVGGNATRAYFEPIATAFKELTPALQLLTESTQVRHAFKFEAEAVPATLTGSNDASSVVVKTTAGTLECKKATYAGSQTEKEKVEFELTPTYSECTALGFVATVDMNECKYRFTATKVESFTKREGSMDIVCPAGKEITVTVKAGEVSKCTIHVPALSNLRTVTYTNIGAGATREITIDVNFTKLAYTHTAGIGIGACATGAAENGTLEAKISVTAENGAGAHVGFFSP